MDRAAFREALRQLDPDDRDGLVTAVQERVRALSGRHLDIQERIEASEENRRDLQARLEDAERRIVEQADASVEADVESIEDVESLPEDTAVEFEPELLAEVRDIREQARSNYRSTATESSGLQAELARNGEELRLHRSVLAEMDEGDLTTASARDRLLEFFEAASLDGERSPGSDDGEAEHDEADEDDARDGDADATDADDGVEGDEG